MSDHSSVHVVQPALQIQSRQNDRVVVAENPPQGHWWNRIRGPRAISWQSVVGGNLLISAAIIASGGTLGGYAIGPDAHGRALVAALVASAIAAVWAIVGFKVLFRDRHMRPVSLWSYFIFYSVNAVVYFACVQWLDVTSVEPSAIGWPARLASSIAIQLAWAIAISLILESSDRFKERRTALLDELVAAELERIRESQEAERLRLALNAQVDEVLAETRDRLAHALVSSVQESGGLMKLSDVNAANIVRAAASDVVRPLSHELQQMAGASYPPPRLSGAMRQWWMSPRMPPLVTALLVSAQTSAESVRNFGGTVGPVAGLAYFACLYAFLVAIDRTGSRFPHWRRGIYLVGVVVTLVANVWFAEGLSQGSVDAGDVLAVVVVSSVYIAVTSLYDALRQARAGLLESLLREVDADELRTRAVAHEMAIALDGMAQELHGRVQTQLVVCAAELDRAAEAGDHEAVNRALTVATSVLESATQPRVATIRDVVNAWASVMEVHADLAGLGESDLVRADIMAVVEEGLANAYRHGDASHADVQITRLVEGVRIVIEDDGVGFTDASEGFGTELLRRLSDGRTALEAGPAGTRLTVHLPRENPG